MGSYGENEKEKREQQELTEDRDPLVFVYFKGISITEEGFLDISSKTGMCAYNSFHFMCWHHIPLPPEFLLLSWASGWSFGKLGLAEGEVAVVSHPVSG